MIDRDLVENIFETFGDDQTAREFILDVCLVDGYQGDPHLTKYEVQAMVTQFGRDLASHMLIDTIRPRVIHVFQPDAPPQPKPRMTLWGVIDRAAAVGLGVFVGTKLLRK